MAKELNKKDQRQSKPFWFARIVVNRWYIVLALSIIIPIIAGLIVGATGSFEFTEAGDFEYTVRSSPISQDYFALYEANEDIFGDDISSLTQGNENFFWTVVVYFRKKEGNVLTAESFNRQREIEAQISAFEEMDKFCFRSESEPNCSGELPTCSLPDTILLRQSDASEPALFGRTSDAIPGYVCDYNGETSVSSEVADVTVRSWFDRDTDLLNPDFAYFLGNDATLSDPDTAYVRSRFRMGSPLEGFENSDDREDEQNDIYQAWAKRLRDFGEGLGGSEYEILVFSFSLYAETLGDLAFADFVWIVGSVIFVLFYMCIHTRSIYLGLMGLLQIILAFPLTYFIYRLIFQVTFFSNLHLLAVFLILGIGADDVFVFTDAFVQAGGVLGESVDLVKRMAWTYRRAAKAMLITSFTTAMAFFVTAANNLIPISAFGIWAASLIIFQYVLCICMFPTNLIVWQRTLRYRYWRKCLKRVEPRTGEVLGSPENEQAMKELLEENAEDEAADMQKATKCLFFIPIRQGTDRFAEKEGGDDDFKGSRPTEMFFHSNWMPFLGKLRYVLIVLMAVVFGLAVWGATLLEPLAEEEQFIPDWHPAQKPIVWSRDFFGDGTDGGDVLSVDVVHGISGVDQSNVGRWDPSDVGTVVYDEEFDVSLGVNREFLVQMCEEIGANRELVTSGDSSDCWVVAFQNYLETERKPAPVPRDTDFNTSENEMYLEVKAFLTYQRNDVLPFQSFATSIALGDEEVLFSVLTFRTPHKTSLGFEATFEIYETWKIEIDRYNAMNQAGVNNAFFTSESFLWMVTEKDLVDSAVRGLGISLAVAFVAILVSTLNLIISFFAIFIIGAIVTCVIAMFYLYGWAWGISESVAVVLIVGFSVDYVVHIANAYVESANTKRYRRTRDAMTEMGITVVAGAITTFGSGIFLIGGVILFFPKFGISLMTTIVLSLLWSTIGFATLALTFGPNNNFASLKPLLRKVFGLCGLCRETDDDEEPQEGEEPEAEEKLASIDDKLDNGEMEATISSSDSPGISETNNAVSPTDATDVTGTNNGVMI